MDETYGTYADDECFDIHDYDDTMILMMIQMMILTMILMMILMMMLMMILMMVGAGTCPGTKKHMGILGYCNIAIVLT